MAATTTGRQDLKKDLCSKEFEALKTCFTNAVGRTTATPRLIFASRDFKVIVFISGKEER